MKLSLLERLKEHVGGLLSVAAPGFSSEPGRLQRVYRRFFRVSGQHFVADTVNEIVLLQVPTKLKGKKTLVRTTYRAPFSGKLLRIGRDYIEVIEESAFTEQRVLIPLTRVVSIEPV